MSAPNVPPKVVQQAWSRLVSLGSATRYVAAVMSVGIEEYIDRFAAQYLGAAGADTFKLVLGLNGEGKTHLLRRLESRALEREHVVAYVEAKTGGAADSPYAFGREVLRNLHVAQHSEESDGDHPLLRLLRSVISRKRAQLVSEGLDADLLLPEWANGLRARNLQPLRLAQALSEGVKGLLGNDLDRALSAVSDLSLESFNPPRSEHNVIGPALLRSIARLPGFLGFNRLVLLVDEAEVAFEGLAQKRRQNLLSLLRFLNDHLSSADEVGAVILVACTDDFWPNRFNEYAALKQRLTDQGADHVEARAGLSLRGLVNKNKVWVRETFRGSLDDYVQLGDALLVVANRALPSLDVTIHTANARQLAEVASSNEVVRVVKRPFVKALAQLVQDQVSEGKQYAIDADQARNLFDLARRSISSADQAEADSDAE
jgi:hypothetical protein